MKQFLDGLAVTILATLGFSVLLVIFTLQWRVVFTLCVAGAFIWALLRVTDT
jgi:hypothetical protein